MTFFNSSVFCVHPGPGRPPFGSSERLYVQGEQAAG